MMKLRTFSRKFVGGLALGLMVAFLIAATGCESFTYRHDLTLYQNGKVLGQWKNVKIEDGKARAENGKAIQVLPADGIQIAGCRYRAGGVVILTRKVEEDK